MTRNRKILTGKVAAVLMVVPVLIIANEDGPVPARTGAPGEMTCAEEGDCHPGTANTGLGNVEIVTPKRTYTPGERQSWSIRINDSSAILYGFQATARPASDAEFGQAGRFETAQTNTLVTCQDGSFRFGAASCPPHIPIEYIQHDVAPSQSNEFHVDWIAPATDIGRVNIYVAANAANGDGEKKGDLIYTSSMTLFTEGPSAIRSEQPVLQAFDNQGRISSGTWLQIFGENLAFSNRSWEGRDFNGNQAPTTLDDVQVLINGKNAFVSYIDSTQINAQAPDDEALGEVSVQVINGGQTSNSITMTKTKVSPALQEHPLFRSGDKSYVVALRPTDPKSPLPVTYIGPEGLINGVRFRPAIPGDTIILYVVGCGNADNPAGQIPVGAPPITAPYEIRIGGVAAEAVGVVAPFFVGLFQFNVVVPNVADGDHKIELTLDGVGTGQDLWTNVRQ